MRTDSGTVVELRNTGTNGWNQGMRSAAERHQRCVSSSFCGCSPASAGADSITS
jgi:hypothetical protein